MPRNISDAVLAALQAPNVKLALFVSIEFISETAYIWSGLGTISWNGQTWQGAGDLLGLSVVEEGSDVLPRGISITLSGFNENTMSEFMLDYQLNRTAVVYLAVFDGASPPSILADPVVAWAGNTDQPTIDVSGETATIAIACENPLVGLNVAVDRRYTNEDQQRDHPGDLGFQFVAALQEQTLYWGRTPTSTNNI